MAAIQFKRNGVLSVFEFDVTLQETAEHSSELTTHPLETGDTLSDHQKHDNLELTLEVVVTNHPFPREPKDNDIEPIAAPKFDVNRVDAVTITRTVIPTGPLKVIRQGSVQKFTIPFVPRRVTPWDLGPSETSDISQYLYITFKQRAKPFDRVQVIYEELVGLKDRGDECTVIGKHTTFTKMALTNISAPTRLEDSMAFSLTFEQIRFASTSKSLVGVKATMAKVEVEPEQDRAVTAVNNGTAATATPDPELGGQAQTGLRVVAGATGLVP